MEEVEAEVGKLLPGAEPTALSAPSPSIIAGGYAMDTRRVPAAGGASAGASPMFASFGSPPSLAARASCQR